MNITFAQLLKHWKWMGGTQCSLARELGVHYTTFRYWLAAHDGAIPERHHRKVLQIFGVKDLNASNNPFNITI